MTGGWPTAADDNVAPPPIGGVTAVPRMGRTAPCLCPQCGQSNSPERKFCAGCGKQLWEPCLECGSTNGAWENYCGVCGGNLLSVLQTHIDFVQTQERQATSLRADVRHREAIGLLESMEAPEHPRLSPHVERARQFARELLHEVELLEQERDESCQAAREALESKEYEAVMELVEDTPFRLRTPEMQQLLDASVAAQEELAVLAAQIREAVTARQPGGLLAKVRRLLELKPDHAEARRMAGQLEEMATRGYEAQREQLLGAARARLAAHSYEEALRYLEQIHERVRTPEINKLLELAGQRASEFNWLVQDLREVAVFDEFVPPLCDRLVKLKPKDAGLAKFAQKGAQLYEERLKKRRPGDETLLVRSKAETSFGWPVDAIAGFRNIDTSALVENLAFLKQSGGFYVACGLALQGLEQAAIDVNLVPVPKQNVLAKLAGAMLKKRIKGSWGLDVGTRSLKALRLTLDAHRAVSAGTAGPAVVATACELFEYPLPLNHPDVEQEKTIRETLRKFLEKHNLEEDLVGVSFPGSKTLSRFFKLPPTDKKRIPDLVKFEARQQIPFDLESVTWGYQTTDGGQEVEANGKGHEIGMFAVRTHEASQWLYPFGELEMKVDLLQADSVALYNYLHFDRFGDEGTSPQPAADELREVVAALDIGVESSNLVIGNRHFVWLRSIPVGAHHLNRALIAELKLTQAQAEQLKRNPLEAPLVSKVYQAMQPAFRDLVGEMKRSLAYFDNNYREHPVKQMLVVGGGARLHGLVRMLRAPAPATGTNAD